MRSAPRPFLLLAAGLLLTPPAPAAEPAGSGELALRARAVLQKHCQKCHGGDSDRSQLDVLEYDQLVKKERPRPFVIPGDPDASQLVEFVEDGSMPQGAGPKVPPEESAALREWIKAGAPAFPKRFDDAFALRAVAADIRSVPKPDRRFVRYFSLHPLLENDATAVPDLAGRRAQLLKAINGLARKKLESLRPADPTGLVYRIDLRDLGWDEKPFRKIEDDKPAGNSPLNVFDVLLLEYPHGWLYAPSPAVERVQDEFLRPAGQVRPVAFVRGDWFVKLAAESPVADDIRRLLAGPDAEPRGAVIPDQPLKKERPDLRPERKADAARGRRILPFDAATAPDVAADPAPLNIDFEVVDAETHKPKMRFEPGDRCKLKVRANTNAHIEIIWVDSQGGIFVLDLEEGRVPADKEMTFTYGKEGKGFQLGELEGKERLILFASKAQFEPGERLQSRDRKPPVERFVHPFYRLPKDLEKPFDPNENLIKRSVEIEIRKAKK